jgi:DNA-binding Lrp family transcriptional regulator
LVDHGYDLRMPRLDDLDRRLLGLLRENSREPVVRLAAALGVTRATVNNRIERLVDTGVIAGFSIRTLEAPETDEVRALTAIAVERRDAREVVSGLRGIPQIAAMHTTVGRWDLIVEFRCSSLADLDEVLGQIRALHGVRDSETNVLLSSVAV